MVTKTRDNYIGYFNKRYLVGVISLIAKEITFIFKLLFSKDSYKFILLSFLSEYKVFIYTHQTIKLTPQHIFQLPSDRLHLPLLVLCY